MLQAAARTSERQFCGGRWLLSGCRAGRHQQIQHNRAVLAWMSVGLNLDRVRRAAGHGRVPADVSGALPLIRDHVQHDQHSKPQGPAVKETPAANPHQERSAVLWGASSLQRLFWTDPRQALGGAKGLKIS